MSYLGDDVQTLPWSRCRSLCDSQTEPAEKTVVTEVPWFLEQELAALDPNNRPTRLTPYAVLPVLPDRPAATVERAPRKVERAPRKVERAPRKVEPRPEPRANPVLLTFTVGSDPADPDNSSAAVIPLRAGSFRVPSAYVKTRQGLWARARARLLGLVCVAWSLVARTLVLHRAGA